MNAQAFLDLADLIESHARRFTLNTWFGLRDTYGTVTVDSEDGFAVTDLLTNCRTVGCIAGWGSAMLGHGDLDASAVTDHLGITEDQAGRLYYAWQGSVWSELADVYGWDTNEFDDIFDWNDITGEQAAEVLRGIARGDVKL